MAKPTEQSGESFMLKLARFIVDKRNLVFLVVIIGLIFSVFSRSWVQVENDLTAYLPADSETRQALDVMDEQFTTFGTASVMVANLPLADAFDLQEKLEDVEGVQGVAFDETDEHYNNVSALFSVTFDYDEDDERCLDALERVKDSLAGYDLYVSTDLGNTQEETIDHEISVIMVYVAIVIVTVLLFTSETYGEVPVLILTFVVALVLNQGTNFMMGKISFISNSVTSILQLALSIDYAIIFCNRFKEEHRSLPLREAVIVALSKSIPEIGASSLTTIGGLVAMLFMQFKLGPDMALCLIKSILFALLAAFIVMPGLLMLFGPLIDRTQHRSFVPKISFVGKLDFATRYIIPLVFVALAVIGFRLSSNCPYAYGYGLITAPKQNETQFAQQMIEDNFTSKNMLALIVPTGDYDKESAILDELGQYDEVDSTMGLTNIEALDGYMLADKLTPRQFAELAGLDYEAAQVVYAAYAAQHSEYGKLAGNLATYKVPLIDMFLFVCDQVDAGVVTLSDDQTQMLQDAEVQMNSAKAQLEGPDYDRMLVYLTLPESGDETYAFTDKILEIAKKYYPDDTVYLAGESTNEYEFEKSFAVDNKVVSIVSVLVVMLVLLFTFNSAGMPVLLILVIQGCIWINFSVPAITGKYLFYLSYLIVSSIQMGANIDYAIVISSWYNELKAEMSRREAIVQALNLSFPTVLTSGSILSSAGFLIAQITTEPAIVGIGECLCRGTLISMFLVMFILPQILFLGDGIVERTRFDLKVPEVARSAHGTVYVNGRVRGRISGVVDAQIQGVIYGDVSGMLETGAYQKEEEPAHETEDS